MTRVLRQHRWRSTLSLLAMVAWLLGTNFCALGLMAGPCHAAQPAEAAAVVSCPHCPAAQPSSPATPETPPPSCCQEFRAGLPSAGTGTLVPLPPVALPPGDWMDVFTVLSTLNLTPADALPDTGPLECGGVVMRLLLGRCAPVHAPPLASA